MLNVSQCNQGKTTVIILPLLAMHSEYHERAVKHNLSCESWDLHTSSINQPPQILLVAVDSCAWDFLKNHLETLQHIGRLARVVVDEAHLLLKHEGFRPCMHLLQFLGGFPIPIMLMTATCPPNLEKDAFEKIGRTSFQVLRQSTCRPEIQQKLVLLADVKDDKELQSAVACKISLITPSLAEEERMLLFCLSHSDCDEMAEHLGWKPYHSHVAQEERSKSMRMWKAGQIPGRACTSMLNCCLDFPHVHYVFHLGLPRDAVDYSQAIGRCSRDGKFGTAIVYYRHGGKQSSSLEDRFGRFTILQMARDQNLCFNSALGLFLDGHGIPCFARQDAALCSSCERTTAPHASLAAAVPSISNPSLQVLFAAASSKAQNAHKTTKAEDLGLQIRTACDILYKSCVYCWVTGKECTQHLFRTCPDAAELHPAYNKWADDLLFPSACCFYCGGSQRVSSDAHSSSWLLIFDS